MQKRPHGRLIALLDISMTPSERGSVLFDFLRTLLDALGYESGRRMVRSRVPLPFFICGENRHATPSFCVYDLPRNQFLLPVQVNWGPEVVGPDGTKAQLVAGAIAVFNQNNVNREQAGLPRLTEMVNTFMNSLTSFLERLIPPVGHAWHCDGRHVACVLQNPCYQGPVNSYWPRDLPSRGISCDLLLSAHSSLS